MCVCVGGGGGPRLSLSEPFMRLWARLGSQLCILAKVVSVSSSISMVCGRMNVRHIQPPSMNCVSMFCAVSQAGDAGANRQLGKFVTHQGPPRPLKTYHLCTQWRPSITLNLRTLSRGDALSCISSLLKTSHQRRSMGPLLVSENLSNIPAVPTLALPLNSPAGGGHIFRPLVILAGAMVILS